MLNLWSLQSEGVASICTTWYSDKVTLRNGNCVSVVEVDSQIFPTNGGCDVVRIEHEVLNHSMKRKPHQLRDLPDASNSLNLQKGYGEGVDQEFEGLCLRIHD